MATVFVSMFLFLCCLSRKTTNNLKAEDKTFCLTARGTYFHNHGMIIQSTTLLREFRDENGYGENLLDIFFLEPFKWVVQDFSWFLLGHPLTSLSFWFMPIIFAGPCRGFISIFTPIRIVLPAPPHIFHLLDPSLRMIFHVQLCFGASQGDLLMFRPALNTNPSAIVISSVPTTFNVF